MSQLRRVGLNEAGGSGLAEALSEGGYLVTVAAGGHAAPAAMVGACSVVEPEDASVAFAAADKVEVSVGEEVGGGFGEGG